jgi:hypothetical protein
MVNSVFGFATFLRLLTARFSIVRHIALLNFTRSELARTVPPLTEYLTVLLKHDGHRPGSFKLLSTPTGVLLGACTTTYLVFFDGRFWSESLRLRVGAAAAVSCFLCGLAIYFLRGASSDAALKDLPS